MSGIQASREQRAQLKLENAEYGDTLEPVHEIRWPQFPPDKRPIRLLRSRGYLVQVYMDNGAVRLSVNRTTLRADGRWEDGITWDTLQRLKAECGYGDRWAVEVFPADSQVVNVANVRHLFLVNEPPSFAWFDRKHQP